MRLALPYLAAVFACLTGPGSIAAEKTVYSWKATFADGFAFFQEIDEHPSQVRTVSTAQYAMLVKNKAHEFRICRLHYSDDGKTPVVICEDIVGLEDIAGKVN